LNDLENRVKKKEEGVQKMRTVIEKCREVSDGYSQ
jgi:hypothetical protein